ncbi:FeoA family protein [Thiocystis violacea]|uniref:FeoA family protein n=1 Tax=Thiocystis violacea TaxID=13725 RepID=UPI001907DD6D|nr:ferrous iron transport protein A [Thiocystis violacea]MBK1718363.1 iron transporter FeoA [Thiocystis violacea]
MPQSADPIRLPDLPPDTPAHLAEIRGGRHLTRRLLALGLRQGSPLCVVQRRGQGLVLASGGLRIAIGSGIAEKVWVILDPTSEDGESSAPETDEPLLDKDPLAEPRALDGDPA